MVFLLKENHESSTFPSAFQTNHCSVYYMKYFKSGSIILSSKPFFSIISRVSLFWILYFTKV